MPRDIAFALGMLVLSGIFFVETFNFREGSRFSVGPEVYSRYVLGVIIALSTILLVKSLLSRSTGSGITFSGSDIPSLLSKYWRTVAIFGTFAVYAYFLPVFGFPVVTAIFLTGLQLILTPRLTARNLTVTLVIALGATGFIYIIFTEVLHVFLP